MAITIQLKLPILPGTSGGRIIVPGTEPSSAITSTTLEAQLRAAGRAVPAVISVKDALAAIPGSYVIVLDNGGNTTQKMFALPEATPQCPCVSVDDWYEVLHGAATPMSEEDAAELSRQGCDILEDYNKLYGG